jgi:hypothetical protein
VLIALILHPSETVTIVINYADANFLPVGRVIKPTFAMIVSMCKIGITEKNYAPNVMKNTIRMRKNEIVFILKSPKRGRQNIGGIIHIFSAIYPALCKRSM